MDGWAEHKCESGLRHFLSALQNKTKIAEKITPNAIRRRVQCLICRIGDLAGICPNTKAGSVEIVLFEWDRLTH